MVRKIKKDGRTLYVCEECGYAYPEKAWARRCEEWCKKHHACNLEITRHGEPPDSPSS